MIEVIAYFDDRGIHPLRFKWKEKAITISQMIDTLIDEKGQNKKIGFQVNTRGRIILMEFGFKGIGIWDSGYEIRQTEISI